MFLASVSLCMQMHCRHDRKTVELYGATSQVNFPYGGLVDPATMKVYRLRTAVGQELPVSVLPGGEKPKVSRLASFVFVRHCLNICRIYYRISMR